MVGYPGYVRVDVTRIAPKLWMGAAPPGGKTLASLGFDTVVLCASEYQPTETSFSGVKVIRAPFDDDTLTPAADAIAKEAARLVVYEIEKGRRVLVTCYAGKNRSGLVIAKVLAKMSGAPGHLVVDHVQRLRAGALSNVTFVQNIYQGGRA